MSPLLRSLARCTGLTGKRALATPANLSPSLLNPILPSKIPAVLHLKSGQSYEGNAFGSNKSRFGETVFSTSITSCRSVLATCTQRLADQQTPTR
jgi:carbamoyl-phosphate synthase small subunit